MAVTDQGERHIMSLPAVLGYYPETWPVVALRGVRYGEEPPIEESNGWDDPDAEHPSRADWQLPRPTIDEFLSESEPDHVWLIPGLLERGDRAIITSPEGMGKSTLIRQIGVQAAAGIHPFGGEDFDPIRVVLLDLENSRRHVRRQLRPLRISAGARLDGGRLIASVVPEGIDLMHDKGRMALDDLIASTEPDLVLAGPLYKLASGDPVKEEPAQAVRAALDEYRAKYDCAFVLEAHQPYAANGGKSRPLRPYGASLWSRWPEFGIALTDKSELLHWRGQRDERDWPSVLKRGGEWPWTVETDPKAVTFARILDVTRAAGKQLSVRELADACSSPGHLADRNQIQRAISAHKERYDHFVRDLASVNEEDF